MVPPRPSSASSASTCAPICWAPRSPVSCIEPGLVGGTEFSSVRLGDEAKAAAVYAGADALTPDDIADTVHRVASRPARVNINTLEVMPVCQAFSPLAIKRQG